MHLTKQLSVRPERAYKLLTVTSAHKPIKNQQALLPGDSGNLTPSTSCLWAHSTSAFAASIMGQLPSPPGHPAQNIFPIPSSREPPIYRRASVLCCAQLLSQVQLSDPMDCRLPGSYVHWISQERIPKWVSMLSSRGSSQPRDQTQVSHIAVDSLPSEPSVKPKNTGVGSLSLLQGDFPNPGIEPGSPVLQADYYFF